MLPNSVRLALGMLHQKYPNITIMSKLYQGKSQSNTGILVVDNNRRIVSINQNFVELWSVPKYVIDSQNESQGLELVSHYLEEPQKFVKQITEVYQKPELNIYAIIKFKCGRLLEISSQSQWFEEQYVGRVWKSREPDKFIFDEPKSIVYICPFLDIFQK
ncbi:MAG: hypothetical protein JGK12_30950 [Microcoleus sp. PH2017_01_SCD_O_A]|uniref:hypothetical protein n=1 Tax=unclassified Microcoleus TaxID=2642155 RepID=UPI001D23EDA3|nr:MULTISPECIES: hypothetical protein [unclassified Microcoleus]MCC3413880.1 hypothetical protein [Microcoleus sp. PH2017_02_FOX_O_A]MCC3431408.1 hypothetical protein [Microcoleus sp. PH2017_04_SCI_O_A]MCC3466226.1 hypothetical protein [Microcoleus sp. PH2017_06_SFM_O_A]MCC3428218.1 hypothetical protein [Microcoleus sp. PH2017_01_SCD_O_A]MCC3435346.1 hypothetical protein [Microcoleus sp. PH2017_05_CCC_O_A]